MAPSRRTLVEERAGHRCEYCLMPISGDVQPFQLDHVRAQKHSGVSSPVNLAWSCLPRNRHKGPNLAGIERTGALRPLISLFHPRRHKWIRHFRWDGPVLVGRTPVSRVTIQVLSMNAPLRIALREELIAEGLFLPAME